MRHPACQRREGGWGSLSKGRSARGGGVGTVLGPALRFHIDLAWDQAQWTHRGTLCLDPLALTLRGLDLPRISVSNLPAGLAHHPPQL